MHKLKDTCTFYLTPVNGFKIYAFFFSENNSTDSAMPHKSKVISIFDVGSPTSTSLTDRVECNSEDGSMGNRPVSNGTSAEVENVNLDLNQGTDDHLLSPSRIQVL